MSKPATAVGATVLALIVGEFAVRSLGRAPNVKAIRLGAEECVYTRSTNPILGFELKANYRHADPDYIQSYERTNAHGQRDKERAFAKREGVKRIILLGDSVVEGYGLREHETVSRQLEALFPVESVEVLKFWSQRLLHACRSRAAGSERAAV